MFVVRRGLAISSMSFLKPPTSYSLLFPHAHVPPQMKSREVGREGVAGGRVKAERGGIGSGRRDVVTTFPEAPASVSLCYKSFRDTCRAAQYIFIPPLPSPSPLLLLKSVPLTTQSATWLDEEEGRG